MNRWLIIFILVVGAIWYGTQHMGQKAEDDQATAAASDQSAPAAHPAPSAAPQPTFQTHRSALLGLSRSILQPLENKQAIPQADAEKKLQELKIALANFPSDPGYARAVQTCAWLEQALKERRGFIARIEEKSPATGLDKVPGQWFAKDTSLNPGANKSVDINAQNQNSRSSFFANAALNEWRARANYYRPFLERLLSAG